MTQWRLVGVVLAVVVSVMLVFGFARYYAGLLDVNEDAVYVGFYASLVEDVVFFGIVGLAVLIYTAPFRSDEATFEERLFAFYGRGAPRSLKEYASQQFKRFGVYCTRAERSWLIEEYDDAIEGYRVQVESTFMIRNLFRDVEYVDDTAIRVGADHFKRMPDPLGELVRVQVGEDERELTEEARKFGPYGFDYPVPIKIPKGQEKRYYFRYWNWLGVDQDSAQTPLRVVETFNASIINRMNRAVTVKFPDDATETTLAAGEVYRFVTRHNVNPTDTLFRFRLVPPPSGETLGETLGETSGEIPGDACGGGGNAPKLDSDTGSATKGQ